MGLIYSPYVTLDLARFLHCREGCRVALTDEQVKGKFSLMSSRSEISFTNKSDGAPITLHLKGDWTDRSAEITLNGRPVASIGRSFMNFGQLISDRQTYFVTCAPGVDLVLMAAICVCLDERENDEK